VANLHLPNAEMRQEKEGGGCRERDAPGEQANLMKAQRNNGGRGDRDAGQLDCPLCSNQIPTASGEQGMGSFETRLCYPTSGCSSSCPTENV
jgi:hypothetical protein